jgi:hypothetical protein
MVSNIFKKYNLKIIFKIAITICSLNIILSLLYSYILNFLKYNYKPNPIPYSNIYEEFFLVVCFAPIFETIIFQYLPVYIFRNFDKKLTIIVSTFFFALSHWFNIINFIYGFFIGILFILGYFYSVKKGTNPILTILFSHTFYNLYAFVMNNFFK